MDRDSTAQGNSRKPSNQLLINKQDRRPLFSSNASAQPTSSTRPFESWSSGAGKPTLARALELAEREEAGESHGGDQDERPQDASPSPAPRSWRAKGTSDGPATRVLGARSPSPSLAQGQQRSWRSQSGDWRNKSRSEDLRMPSESDLPPLVPGIEDVPFRSVEGAQGAGNDETQESYVWQVDQDFTAGDLQVSDSPRIKARPKSFEDWQPRRQQSDSNVGRMKLGGTRNGRLDEIRSLEINTEREPPARRERNTKLDDIKAREEEVERQIPIGSRHLDRLRSNKKLDEIRQREVSGLSKRAQAQSKLSEIRERNSQSPSISPRALEASRAHPGGLTPESRIPVRHTTSNFEAGERILDMPVTVYKNRQRKADLGREDGRSKGRGSGSNSPKGPASRQDDSRDLLRRLSRAASASPKPEAEMEGRRQLPSLETEKTVTARSDSTRRSNFAKNNNDTNNNSNNTNRRSNSRRTLNPEPRTRERDPSNPRPSVGFAGLRRKDSSESAKSKRSSMASDDPEDRIMGELKLFAPTDNHSERGSVRAPSPTESEADEEPVEMEVEDVEEEDVAQETPRPKKQDPLTMPTPRVTGAYIETPVTVKVEKFQDDAQEDSKAGAAPEQKPKSLASGLFSLLRDERSRDNYPKRTVEQDTASDPGTADVEIPDPITASILQRRPRARSLPRRRPPLKNSARPPSVRDDLLELKQLHNIDDSTIDDLDEILAGREAASPKLEALLDDKLESESDLSLDLKNLESSISATEEHKAKRAEEKEESALERRKKEIATYARMSKTLQTVMQGTRSAKQGIERLEDQVSHTDSKMAKMTEKTKPKLDDEMKIEVDRAEASSASLAYVNIPIPRLYHTKPDFHLTILGIIFAALAIWYATESATCAVYCRPEVCNSPPCIYSLTDPSFGVAIPVKIDQLLTNGAGREVLSETLQEAEDWVADVMDGVWGRNVTQADLQGMTFKQRRQYWRRLRKKGIVRGVEAGREDRMKWDAWRKARVRSERQRELGEMGYGRVEEESFDADQRVW